MVAVAACEWHTTSALNHVEADSTRICFRLFLALIGWLRYTSAANLGGATPLRKFVKARRRSGHGWKQGVRPARALAKGLLKGSRHGWGQVGVSGVGYSLG